jgi:hypothetical protein
VTSYRVGIVGLTGIATAPAPEGPVYFGGVHPHSHVACYANHPWTEVVAICDLVPALFDDFDRRLIALIEGRATDSNPRPAKRGKSSLSCWRSCNRSTRGTSRLSHRLWTRRDQDGNASTAFVWRVCSGRRLAP